MRPQTRLEYAKDIYKNKKIYDLGKALYILNEDEIKEFAEFAGEDYSSYDNRPHFVQAISDNITFYSR